ncbi:hypothetical protein TNCV_2036931 [Trichonephila clavipes]|nr:hypothetical protein TNCV_2036931 [Trichonephila clavipes]
MNDLSGSSFFPKETSRIDSAERVSPKAGGFTTFFSTSTGLKLENKPNQSNPDPNDRILSFPVGDRNSVIIQLSLIQIPTAKMKRIMDLLFPRHLK